MFDASVSMNEVKGKYHTQVNCAARNKYLLEQSKFRILF